MADQIVFNPNKSSSLRRVKSGGSWIDNWLQAKGEEHALQGYNSALTQEFRSLMQFPISFPGVKSLTFAQLHLFTAADHSGLKPQAIGGTAYNVCAGIKKTSWSEAGGGEAVWTGALANLGAEWNSTYRSLFHADDQSLHETVINVMSLVRYWTPTGIATPLGKGLGHSNYGLVLSHYGSATYETVFASAHHVNTSIRPFLVVGVELIGGPGVAVTSAPNGNIPRGVKQFFLGEYQPGRPDDNIAGVTIIRHQTGKPDVTEKEWTPDSNAVLTSTFAVPVNESWPSATPFTWQAKVRNNKNESTPLSSPALAVQWVGTPPVLTAPQPSAITLDSLISVPFRVTASVSVGTYRAARWRIQLRPQTAPTDPTWDSTLHWDSGPVTVPLTADEQNPATTALVQNLSMLYGGPLLAPGDYSWRVQAEDPFGATSPWIYSDVTLVAPFEEEPGTGVNLTGYGKSPPFRIRIFGMGALRGPGVLLAELTDASNGGASEFYNSAGEFYFTLPVNHPQVGVIEPYQCHYALEIHTEQGWRGKAYGLITNFDANEDEVVFYGTDYLGLLARAVDERFDPTNADLPTDKGGAKYVDQTISSIILDQLQKAKAAPNSPVGFITIAPGDIPAIAEKVTIYASFKQRLPFIAGLIESSKAGTGRKTRLICERSANGAFKWRVLYDPGLTRDNLRLEYGGLVNGFRTVPFSNWGTSVAAVGRTVLGTKVYSAVAVAPGISETIYGHWPSNTSYADLDDLNDLRRRAVQAATKVSKVGKQMGIALRVNALTVKDGWDIADSVPVWIKVGVVDTQRFGSGYFTIWGWTWSSFPDGHTGLVLSVSPREDATAPNADLIPSQPILTGTDWQVGYGVPDTWGVPPVPTPPPSGTFAVEGRVAVEPLTYPLSDDSVIGIHYQDLNSGCIYELDQDPASPTYLEYSEVYCPDTSGGGGGTVDTTPPTIPVIKSTDSELAPQDDGTSMVGISALVGYDGTHPAGPDNDLGQYLMQSTKFELTPGVPDWGRATEWTTVVADPTGATDARVVQPSVQAATLFWLRAAARDHSGNLSGWSGIATVTSDEDTTGPPAPLNIVTVPGNRVFAVRWDGIDIPDLAYVEVQWKKSTDADYGVSLRAAGTLIVVTEVENDVPYNVRVRSVDTSGNTLSGKATDDTLDWVPAPDVTPVGVSGSDVVFTSADIEDLLAGEINADWITSGTFRVGHVPAGLPDTPPGDTFIEVYGSTGLLIGRWSTAGIEVLETNSTINYKLQITESGLTIKDYTDPLNPITVVTLSPLGIDAASITFGTARGGHNLVLNSSFEMGSFVASTNTLNTWDVTADFTATRLGADTNITITGGTTLGMTAI